VLVGLHQGHCFIYKGCARPNTSVVLVQHESKYDDEIWAAYTRKKPKDFWKAWAAKYKKNVNANVKSDGCMDDTYVANRFADKF